MTADEGGSSGPGLARYRRAILRAAVTFLVVLVLLTFFSRTILTLSLPRVSVVQPTSGALMRQLRAGGTVASTERAELYVDSRRKVLEARVRAGDTVRAGAILLVLDADELAADLAQALAGVRSGGWSLDAALEAVVASRLATLDGGIEIARTKVEGQAARVKRAEDLKALGAESAESVNRERLALSQATQDLAVQEEAREQRRGSLLQQLRAALVVAPVDAVVTSVAARAGGWADPSGPAVSLLPRGAGLELKVTVPLEQSKLVGVGETVEVSTTDGSQRRGQARITRIAETGATGGGYREVTMAIPRDSDLRAGDSAELSLQKQTRAYTLLVANSAVGRDAQGAFVRVLKERSGVLGTESYVVKSSVTIEASDDFMTAIASGLEAAENVVVRSSKPLVDAGSRVIVE